MTQISQSEQAAIRLLLVDDHPTLREGLKRCLELEQKLKVVGEAGSGREALILAKELHPDLMLVDISMKDMNGILLTKELKSLYPTIRVLIFTMDDNEATMRSAAGAGACGYLTKEASSQKLITVINMIVEGGTFYPKDILHEPAPLDTLTDRENEVLVLVAQGLRNKKIAAKLAIEVRTVETYRSSVRKKLEIDTPAEFMAFALKHGLINGKL